MRLSVAIYIVSAVIAIRVAAIPLPMPQPEESSENSGDSTNQPSQSPNGIDYTKIKSWDDIPENIVPDPNAPPTRSFRGTPSANDAEDLPDWTSGARFGKTSSPSDFDWSAAGGDAVDATTAGAKVLFPGLGLGATAAAAWWGLVNLLNGGDNGFAGGF